MEAARARSTVGKTELDATTGRFRLATKTAWPHGNSSACGSQLHTFVQPFFRNFHRPTHVTGSMLCVPWPTGFS